MRRPSPSLVISVLALFVALGGTGYAALKLPKNSVGAKQIKKNAVTGAKVKNASLTADDFKASDLPQGPKGDTGPAGAAGAPGRTGPAGPAGTAIAWARVNKDGTILDGGGLKFLGFGTIPVYCFDRPDGAVRAVLLTTDAGTAEEGTPDPKPLQLAATVSAARIQQVGCPSGTDFFVAADKADTADRTVPAAFYVGVIA